MNRSIFPSVALLVLLTGCTRSSEVILELTPSVVSECLTPVATRVRWDVSPLGLQWARLEVNNLGAPRKLWMAGPQKGEAESGAWAHDGYTVTLMSNNGVVLARRTLITEPCRE